MAFAIAWAGVLSVQTPLVRGEGRPINLAIADGVLLAALVVLLPRLRLARGSWSPWHAVLPVALAVSVSTLGTLSRYALANKVLGIFVLLASYLLVTSSVRSWSDIAALLRSFYVGVAAVNGLALVLFLARLEIPLLGCQTCARFAGFMPDPNLNGSLLVLAIGIFLVAKRSILGPLPVVWQWTSFAMLVVGLVLTLSRSAWISLLVMIVGVAVIQGRKAARSAMLVAVIALATAGIVFLVNSEGSELARVATRTHSVDSRVELVSLGIGAFLERPLTGIGLGNFAERYGQIIHTTPLWLAAELGVVGIIGFLGLAGWVGGRLRVALAGATGYRREVVAFLVASNLALLGFSLVVEAMYQRHWWMVLGLSAAASQLVGSQPEASGW